ncbi:hypothetical protein L596_027042 [Steinernema carpocapsae]|uniref:Exonuclease domain-containing protein n=1 Tax=Steinernema carpocapsae TaxID=34508 RepID=A0A4U5M373_STECR|nr:hypothetical protein L596_027042 [Steinernema carpocapsae]
MSLEELSALISEASKRKPKERKEGTRRPLRRYEDPNEPLRCEGYQAPAKKDQNEISDLLAKSVFLTKANLQKELEELQLNTGGTSQQMRDRLKRRLRKDLLSTREYEDEFSRNKLRQHFDFLVIIDFECTCEDEVVDYPFEIIEFPAVLVDTHQKKIVGVFVLHFILPLQVSRFRTFVRPKVNPVLSAFCVELTGVTQADVDKAPRFSEAVLKFHRWLFSHVYVYPSGQHDFGGLMKSYAIVTDGPWDLGKFFQLECIRSERYNAKIPHHFRAYINIRRVFTLKYKKTHALSKVNLAGMLAVLGMEFEGREHCGLDDAMNLARAIRMMEDGAEFRINEKLVAAEYADKYTSFVPTISTTGMSTAERDRRKWRLNLPYRIVNICKDRFMTGAYADCDSCDEDANYEKAANRK